MNANTDYLWTVCQPRNGSPDAIAEMNARLVAFTPGAFNDEPELVQDAKRVLEEGVSAAAIVQYGRHL